jgi:tetratricopeptide (TPR) repeat protein
MEKVRGHGHVPSTADVRRGLRAGSSADRGEPIGDRRRTGSMRSIATWGWIAVALIACEKSAPPPRPALEPSLVRYRHAAAVDPDRDLDATIAALEARAATPAATPFDLADLADGYLRRAQQRGADADYRASEAMARRSLAMLASPNRATLTLARLAAARHDFAEAIALARRQVATSRGAGPRIVLASAYLAIGELVAAASAAEDAVAAAPTTASYLMRALVMQAQGRDAEAGFDFARAVAAEDHGDPREAVRLRALWARFLVDRGALAAAHAVLAEAMRVDPDDPLALAQGGELALREGRAADGVARFRRAFGASGTPRYLIDLARGEELAGDRAGAERTRRHAERLLRADLATHGVGHRLELAELLIDRGQPAGVAEAVSLARAELARRATAETRFQLARALAAAGARAAALAEVRIALGGGAPGARLYELAARLETGPRAALYAAEARRRDPGDTGWRGLGLPPR